MRDQLKWYDDKADNSAWLDALAELRQRAAREGYCYQHVQAITVAIVRTELFVMKIIRAITGVFGSSGILRKLRPFVTRDAIVLNVRDQAHNAPECHCPPELKVSLCCRLPEQPPSRLPPPRHELRNGRQWLVFDF
ncbi:hypothetical protein [Bradyrhizobium sp. sBnM-33]|uniref:hypothetical protein n=1 Tax=Bradyrhizobium sp. sBnM-33 TaxID=2831780 RepID=UPI001BD0A634|nr:hypothetical protein [Bradyrhizobium sp. sBnM-33]WOH47451.1 hypothetical protein RX328_25040 [Bradyrhizobium sp. sBnM-33]